MKRFIGALLCLKLMFLWSAQALAEDAWLSSEEGDFMLHASTSEFMAGSEAAAMNNLVLTFKSLDAGLVEYVDFSVEDFVPYMPTMDHGTAAMHDVDLSYGADNQALVSNIYFSMATMDSHYWVIYLDVNLNGLSNKFVIPVTVGM